MANIAPRVLRNASVVCSSLPLDQLHSRVAKALGVSITTPGKPGGTDAVLDRGPRVAANSYLLAELFSKFDDGTPNPVKGSATWEKFHEAEHLCFETNQRLAVSGLRGPHERVLLRARDIAAKILGRFDWDAAAEYMGWGPGASTRLPRHRSDAAYKYSGHPETTYGNAALAHAAIRCVPSWERELANFGPGDVGYCNIVPGNRITTVPKNYKTDRTIAIEPCMNMYVQKGIGGLMRKRLKMFSCDLADQTRNQRLAQVGAVAGTLATIDLSMASDTVSRVLVSLLIRSDWLAALERCRSQFGVLPSGEKIFYQKFSSMGNGFTFELESLIFYSLAIAWTEAHGEEVCRVSVYGDDIILPSSVADGFVGLLRFCGFKTNEKKSYWTGPFRESCGKHFLSEHDITPFYIRRPVKLLPDLFLVHNNLYRWLARQVHIDRSSYAELRRILAWIRSFAPARWRKPRLLDGFGDGAFIGSFDEVCPQRAPFGLECWVVSVLATVPIVDMIEIPGLMPKALAALNARHRTAVTAEPSEVHPAKGVRHKEIKILLPWFP